MSTVLILLYERQDRPEGAWEWAFLVLVGLVAGFASSGLIWLLPWEKIRKRLSRLPPRLVDAWKELVKPEQRGIALAVVLVLGLVTGLGFGGSSAYDAVRSAIRGCVPPFELRVLTSPEERGAFRSVASDYEAWVVRQDGCRTVNLTVYAAPWPRIREALVAGWESRSRPRPDVWLPQTSLRLANLQDLTNLKDKAGVTLTNRGSIAWSPVVLGVPSSVVDKVGPQLREGNTWDELLAAVRAAGLGIVRPDPSVSITGKLGTAALYRGKLDHPRRLTAIEQRIAGALDRGGYPLGGATSVLCRLRQQGDALPPVAVLVSERALIRYDDGHALGKGCRGRIQHPDVTLVAFYPNPTYLLDHPFVRVDWPGAPEVEERQRAIERLEQWLRGPEGEQALMKAGLRPVDPADDHAGSPRPGEDWVRANVKFERTLEAGYVSRVMAEYADRRGPVRLLLALDASGSMSQVVQGEGKTRFEFAAEGAKDAARLLGPRDAFGLWVFPGEGERAYDRIIRIGSAPEGRPEPAALVGARLTEVTAGGGTPLFDTIAAGVQRLAERASPDARTASISDNADEGPVEALVVLTDGNDSGSEVSRAELLDLVPDSEVRVFALAVGTGGCTDTTLTAVTRESRGQCFGTDVTGLPDVLEKVFRLLRGDAPNE